MSYNLAGGQPDPQNIAQISPELINPYILKDIAELIRPMVSMVIPPKRSGFKNVTFIIFKVCIQLLKLSPAKVAELMENKCKQEGISFQNYNKKKFSNNKERRFFPDQPAYSRYNKRMEDLNCVEEFWNLVLLGHFLYLRRINIVGNNIKLIADYTDTPCVKDSNNSYCFGKKDGKTAHRTLTFSVVSGKLHQIIANFKIEKRQDKLPLFEKVVDTLHSYGFNITTILIDRGFYRKRLLSFFKAKGIGVIMPGRKCKQTDKKISDYLDGKGSRYCKGFINLSYKKGFGFTKIHFHLLLVAKRKYTLKGIKKDLKKNNISLTDASKRIFPLLVMFGKNGGVSQLRGNESYIRNLYRRRWLIEIAFREMNRLGISVKSQNRDLRLGEMGVKSMLYNIWQVQRYILKKDDPDSEEFELIEFLGGCYKQRYPRYLS